MKKDDELNQVRIGLLPERLLASPEEVVEKRGDIVRQSVRVKVAVHQRCTGRFERRVDPLHFAGVVGFRSKAAVVPAPAADAADPELLRPLIEYERLVGGRW